MTDLTRFLQDVGFPKRQAHKASSIVEPDPVERVVPCILQDAIDLPKCSRGAFVRTHSKLYLFGHGGWRLHHRIIPLGLGQQMALASAVWRRNGASVVNLGVVGQGGEILGIVRNVGRDQIVTLSQALGLDATKALGDFYDQESVLVRTELEAAEATAALRRDAEIARGDPEVRRRASMYRTLITAQATISTMMDGAEALVRTVARKEGVRYYPLESAAIFMLQPVVFSIGNHREYEPRDVAWVYEAMHGIIVGLDSIHTAANVVEAADWGGIDEEAVMLMARGFNEQAVIARAHGDLQLACALAGFAPFVELMHQEWPRSGSWQGSRGISD